jgi:hypothetical protein
MDPRWTSTRAPSHEGFTMWAVEVSTTDRRCLTLDELITCWVSGLVPGEALAGHDGGPWRQRIRDLPEVRARLGIAAAAVRDTPRPPPVTRRKQPPEATSTGAEPDSASTIVEALARYAEDQTSAETPVPAPVGSR